MVEIVVPALLAGAVAIAATVSVERLGGRLGGVLASIPTTIVPATLGIWATRGSPEAFADAMGAVPVGMLVDVGFLWAWRAGPPRLPSPWSLRRRLVAMTLGSLGVWFVGALIFVQGMAWLAPLGVSAIAVGAAAWAAQLLAGIASCWRAPPAPGGTRPVRRTVLLARGALAAVAIAVAIAVGRAGAPLAAGVASVFPAIFLTTMVSLWVAQGQAVTVGAVGPIVLGSSSVGAFALLAATLVPALGPGPGVVASWLAAVLAVSLPAAGWLSRSPERQERT